MTGGDGFVLGVDFGTSNTVAMLRRPDGRVTPLLFDGTPVLPSAVFAAPDRTLFVGGDALHHGRHRPDGLEPNPKRHIDEGTVLLSGTECTVPDLVGAVLKRVADEACRVAGHRPGTLVLSHPAGWGPVRRLTLADAAVDAGLPTPVFVPEPVAAAMYFTSVLHNSVPTGAALLVYDLGAGTFDVTVLRAGASFEVLGSDGLDDVGGLDVDAAVVAWLRTHYADDAWDRLSHPASPEDRRLRLDLWAEARVAKEMLSRTAAVVMRPPLLEQEIPLTLAEFEHITQPLIDRTVRTAQGLARYCEVTAAQVLLVGGSSRIPLVATALHRAFGVPPTVTEQPETVVAEGCVFAPGVPPLNRDPALSTVLPIGAGLSTEPFTVDVGPGALPAAPLGRSVLPAVQSRATSSAAPTAGLSTAAPTAAGPEAAAPPMAALPVAAPSSTPPPSTPPPSAAPPVAAPSTAGPVAAGPVAAALPPSAPSTVATLPASALPPGAIPGARAGDPPGDTGLLWPPLPPTLAMNSLAGTFESTADTARLLPVSHGTPRNAGPGRQLQRSATNTSTTGSLPRPAPTPPTATARATVAPTDAALAAATPTTARPVSPAAAPPVSPAAAPPVSPAAAPPVSPAAPPVSPAGWPALPPMPDDRVPATAPTPPADPTFRPGPLTSSGWPALAPPEANSETNAAAHPKDEANAGANAVTRANAVAGGNDVDEEAVTEEVRPTPPRQASPPTRLLRVPTQSPVPPRQARPVEENAPRPRRAKAAVALLAVVFLLAAAAVTLIVTVPDPRTGTGSQPSAGPPFPSWSVRYADSLGTQRGWSAAANPDEKVECAFRNGRLEIDMRKGGIFRCPGQRDDLTDFALQLDVFLLDGRACAGIWFRRGTHEGGKDSSYVLTVCRTELVLGYHHADGGIAEFAQFPVAEVGTGVRTVVGLVVKGGDISLYVHGRFVGTRVDTAFPGGRLALGIAVSRDLGAGRVGFSNVELRTP